MPAPIARFWLWGMALTSHSRAGLADRATNNRPDTNTQPSASRQSPASSGTTVKAKKAFWPMPGGRAMGRLATRPIAAVASAADKAVAMKTAPRSMPAADRICGLTNRI